MTNPIATTFDLQRDMTEQLHRAASRNIDVQRRAMRAVVDTVDAQRSAGDQASALLESALESAFLISRASIPANDATMDKLEAQFREQVEAIDELGEGTLELWMNVAENGAGAYDEYADLYDDAVDASFDAALETNEWFRDRMMETIWSAEQPAEGDGDSA